MHGTHPFFTHPPGKILFQISGVQSKIFHHPRAQEASFYQVRISPRAWVKKLPHHLLLLKLIFLSWRSQQLEPLCLQSMHSTPTPSDGPSQGLLQSHRVLLTPLPPAILSQLLPSQSCPLLCMCSHVLLQQGPCDVIHGFSG